MMISGSFFNIKDDYEQIRIFLIQYITLFIYEIVDIFRL